VAQPHLEAAAVPEAERSFRNLTEFEDLWMLKAILDDGCIPGEEWRNPIDADRVAA
jgi:hypothetical protein